MSEPRRILIADDEPEIRAIVELLLRGEGYDVVCAADGQEAADRAAEVFARVNAGGEEAFFREMPEEAVTFRAGEGVFAPALEEAAAALDPGQISGILESEEGFSILRRGETDTAGLAVAWLDGRLLAWAEEAEVLTSAAYEEVDVAARGLEGEERSKKQPGI